MSKKQTRPIECSLGARELVKAQKRGGETYDKVLRKMVDQYDPTKAEDSDVEVAEGRGTKIPCTHETRELVKAQKCGGETYDELLPKMVDQYDPEKAYENPASDAPKRGNA
jgi:hypothetical protein